MRRMPFFYCSPNTRTREESIDASMHHTKEIMQRKILSKLLCFAIVISMLIPSFGIGDVYAANKYEDDYNLQMRSDVVPPKATKTPFDIKLGETLHIGVEVANKNGYQWSEEDPDFGDEIEIYTDIKWKAEDDGVLLSSAKGTHISVVGKKLGTHNITVTYGSKLGGKEVKPLHIVANVVPNDKPVEKKVAKIVTTNIDKSIKVDETKEYTIKGLTEANEDVTPNLSVVINDSEKKKIEVSAKGNKLTIKGLDGGDAWFRLKDKDGAEAKVEVSVIDTSIWDFDTATGTLKGFKNPNNPTEVVIPEKIKGVKVKAIAKDAFKISSYGTPKLKNKIKKLTLPEGLESIGYMAFQMNDISEITLPSTLTKMDGRVFYGNKNLKKVNFPKTSQLTSLGDETFQDTGIEEIELPEYITKIDSGLFSGTPLKKIKFSENLKEIGQQAFFNTMIEEFTIPASVEKLNLNSKGKEGSNGIFSRTSADKSKDKYPGGLYRFTKVYDKSGKATVKNTMGIVNPQEITIKYQDEKGKEIDKAIVATGYEKNKLKPVPNPKYPSIINYEVEKGDGHYYTDYLNPFSNEPVGYNNKVYGDFHNEIIGDNYFVEGKTYEFSPKYIAGYVTPEKKSETITKDNHEIIFVYKEAPKVTLTLEGDGIKSVPPQGQVSIGQEVNFTVTEPENKQLDKLLVNDKDIKDELKFGGIKYSGKITIEKDTVIKAVYKDVNAENKLEIKVDKQNLKLGEVAGFKVLYRGQEIALPKEDIVIEVATSNLLKIDQEKGQAKGIESGKTKLVARVSGEDAIYSETEINVEPIKVTVRMEDVASTVLPKTEVEIDKLNLSKGKEYYKDLMFDDPTPILAIEKALRGSGVDTSKQEEFDCGSTGNWMKNLGKGLWSNINENGSFMYTSNNVMADKGVGEYTIKDGDDICIFYDDNWMTPTTYAYFEKDTYEIFEGESVEFVIKGYGIDGMVTQPAQPIKGAYLEINDGRDGISNEQTDQAGKIRMKFDKSGEYKISAVVDNGTSMTRPYANVIVKKKVTPILNPPKLVVENKTINVGEDIDIYSLVKIAEDSDGNDIKNEVRISDDGGFNANKAGTYSITFKLKDKNGITVTKIATVEVKSVSGNDDTEKPDPGETPSPDPGENPGADKQLEVVTEDNDSSVAAEGNKVVYTKGASSKAVYRIKGKALTVDDLISIQVDGKDVAKENYIAETGSIIITFKKSYLDSLNVGRHKVIFNTKQGVAKAELVVKAESQVNAGDKLNKGNAAKTGDATGLETLTGLLMIATGMYLYLRKRKN